MLRAESVTLSGGELAAVLLVLFAVFALWVAAVVAGCRWAWRTGTGEEPNPAKWAVAATVAALPSIWGGLAPDVTFAVCAVVVLGQVGLFTAGRSRRRPGGD